MATTKTTAKIVRRELQEKVYEIYQRMGRARSIRKLRLLLADQYPALLRAEGTLEVWSKNFDWQKRIKAHEDSMRQGACQARHDARATAAAQEKDVDQIAMLVSAANKALKKAMDANPVITKPGDVKTLVDAAANALKLVETIRNQSTGKVSREEVARDIREILDKVWMARLNDIEIEVEKRLKQELEKRGIAYDPVAEPMQVLDPRVEGGEPMPSDDELAIEADEPDQDKPEVRESEKPRPKARGNLLVVM